MKFTLFTVCLVAGAGVALGYSLPNNGKADEIDCPPIGDFYLAHPDCTKYYRCSNGFLFEQTCPGSTYWNPAVDECGYPADVPECVGGTRPPTGTDPTVPPTDAPVTTSAPEVTTQAPEVTTEAPVVTTAAPEITTAAPEITTEGPTEVPTNAPPTTVDPFNPCQEDGIYAVPVDGDCSAYVQCVNGLAIPQFCADGLLFDKEIGKCNKEELVDCSVPTTTAPVITTTEVIVPTEAPICKDDGVYNVPFEGNCSLYILCANGVPVLQACHDELLFDPIELTCVRAEDSTCVAVTEAPEVTTEAPEVTTEAPEVTTEAPEVTTEAPEVTTEAPEVTTEAPEVTTEVEEPVTTSKPPVRCLEDGIYAQAIEDGDCTDYILCVNTIPYLQSCADGTLFSPEEGTCVREENYKCPSSEVTTPAPTVAPTVAPTTEAPATEAPTEAPTTAAPLTEAPTTAAPPTEAPTTAAPPTTEAPVDPTTSNPFPCPPTGLVYKPHPDNCSQFYQCQNGELRGVYNCGSGHWFHSVIQACVKPPDSDCTKEPLP